jgi:hypothetical protein
MQTYPTGVFDLYPLYYGARAWLHGGDAYALAAVAPVADHTYTLYRIGNIYPLPAVLAVLPLSFLPPKVAAMVWIGGLTLALLLALRLLGGGYWLLAYWPLVDGLRLEQYTIFVLVWQLLALWAYRQRRPWLLAVCCAVILTKPNQGLVFALALALLARNWRQQLIVNAALWGGSLLLDPRWFFEWLPTLYRHHELTRQPVYWALALFAIPLLLLRDYIGGAVVLQFLLLPFPLPSAYAASTVPLGVLDDHRGVWLVPLGAAWLFLDLVVGPAWATALALILPMVVLSVLRRREQLLGRRAASLVPEPCA